MTKLAIQQYPIEESLPKIQRHDQLPASAKELGRKLDTATTPGYENLYVFVKNSDHLSLLMARTRNVKHVGPQYYCDQFDFPLKVLSWFPDVLGEFRKPATQSRFPAGTLISPDENVDGEMLAVGSTTDGYDITNWSRQDPTYTTTYSPVRLSLKSEFLFELGFLDLWKRLGEQYEKGLL